MDLKKSVLLIALVSLCFSCGSSDDGGGSTPKPKVTCDASVEAASPTGDNTTLIWAEEFSEDGSPCSDNWTYDVGDGGWGNGESQYYAINNATIANGTLKITARKESLGNSQYTSARMKSQGKFNFTYGKVEVKAKLPASKGTWPAIWMLGSNFPTVGWPKCGEIDIMEQTGGDKNTTLGTVHWWNAANSSNASFGRTTSITNVSSEFHIYSLEWSAESVKISVDGVKFYEIANNSDFPFNSDFFLILNVAMGGSLGGDIDPNFTQDSMEIDYVRVYQ